MERSSVGKPRFGEIDNQALLLEQLQGFCVTAEFFPVAYRGRDSGLGEQESCAGVDILLRNVPGPELGQPAGLGETPLPQ